MVDCRYTPTREYIEFINKRDQNTLDGILNQRLEAISVIHCDEWRAYLNLSQYVPNHIARDTVDHTYNFVNPNNGAHTQVCLIKDF